MIRKQKRKIKNKKVFKIIEKYIKLKRNKIKK